MDKHCFWTGKKRSEMVEFSYQNNCFGYELSIETIYKKRTYDARLGEISGDSYGKIYTLS